MAINDNISTDEYVDRIIRSRGYGSKLNANQLMFSGINHRGTNTAVTKFRDHHGYVFFTRPDLNLTYDNLSQVREFTDLRDADPISVQRAIRVYLDPRSAFVGGKVELANGRSTESIESPLVDKFNPFIPLLTNNLINLSGWPDPRVDTYSSQKGIAFEEYAYSNGIYKRNELFELTTTFRNTNGNPIMRLIDTWLLYMSEVSTNMHFYPYPDHIAKREINYDTRIYRILLNETKTRVTTWASTSLHAFPLNSNMGSTFDYNEKEIFSDKNETITVAWQCSGAEYCDPIILDEFNRVVAMFNPDLEIVGYSQDGNQFAIKGASSHRRLAQSELAMFNLSRCYPLINLRNKDFTWWVSATEYMEVMNIVSPTALEVPTNVINETEGGMEPSGARGVRT